MIEAQYRIRVTRPWGSRLRTRPDHVRHCHLVSNPRLTHHEVSLASRYRANGMAERPGAGGQRAVGAGSKRVPMAARTEGATR
ncbi:hypothetical protein GCM10027160_05970 [Streptomyces calidiresistens]